MAVRYKRHLQANKKVRKVKEKKAVYTQADCILVMTTRVEIFISLGLQTGLLHTRPLPITRCVGFFSIFFNINILHLKNMHIYSTTVIFLQNIFVLKRYYDVFFNVEAEKNTVYYIFSREISGFIHWIKVTSSHVVNFTRTVKISKGYLYSVKITSYCDITSCIPRII